MSFSLKNWLSHLFKTAKGAIRPQRSLQAERLLVDAIRLAELPSPVPGEEPRAAFVLARLKTFGLQPEVNEAGDIQVRLQSPKSGDKVPILLFSDLGSKRWHPSESLAHLDAENARGAGLSDSLGCAALLSIAEQWQAGSFPDTASPDIFQRGLLLLFTAKSLDDPSIGFQPILQSPLSRPFAAIGVQGLSLDRIIRPTGSYRLMITISEGASASRRESNDYSNKVSGTLIKTASTLLGMDSLEKTKMYIRKIEAQTVYSLTPEEGELELEIISNESAPLELAMNTVKETAAKIGEEAGLKAETAPLSFIPPGNPENSDMLRETLRRLLKEQYIKVRDETSADPASFFSGEGIPALSLGIALGREGAEQEFINIDSIDKGRRVLERLVAETGTLNEPPQAQEG